MFMDYRPQQPGEHDFAYTARILKAVGTKFEAMLANESFSLDDLHGQLSQVQTLFEAKVYPVLWPAVKDKPRSQMSPVEEIADTLTRVERQLRDVVRMQLSPAAWDTHQPDDHEQIVVHSVGPEWEGLPGTHPLLSFVRSALAAVRQIPEAK